MSSEDTLYGLAAVGKAKVCKSLHARPLASCIHFVHLNVVTALKNTTTQVTHASLWSSQPTMISSHACIASFLIHFLDWTSLSSCLVLTAFLFLLHFSFILWFCNMILNSNLVFKEPTAVGTGGMVYRTSLCSVIQVS